MVIAFILSVPVATVISSDRKTPNKTVVAALLNHPLTHQPRLQSREPHLMQPSIHGARQRAMSAANQAAKAPVTTSIV